jgi:hypothetical protein
VKENYMKTKFRPVGILNLYAVIYFKFKLRFTFMNNKTYFIIIVNLLKDLQ